MRKYGQLTPPPYDLSKIANKIALAHGELDELGDMTDVNWLYFNSTLS